MELILLKASPYARKPWIVLEEMEVEYELKTLGKGLPVSEIRPFSPTYTIPVFRDGDVVLFDSSDIMEYLFATPAVSHVERDCDPLATTLVRAEHRWKDRTVLSVLNTVGSSIVTIRMMGMSGIAIDDAPYLGRQRERIEACLDWLEAEATPAGFIPGVFSAMDISLISITGYLDFRNVLDWRGRPNLEAIVQRHEQRPSVAATMPTD